MADQPVPPLPTPRMPVMSEVKLTSAAPIAPAVALRKPESEPTESPPPVMLSPPANVEVAVVEVAMIEATVGVELETNFPVESVVMSIFVPV